MSTPNLTLTFISAEELEAVRLALVLRIHRLTPPSNETTATERDNLEAVASRMDALAED